jgi:hypothetical protein
MRLSNCLPIAIVVVAGLIAPATASAQVSKTGAFTVMSSKDPLDRSNRSFAISSSKDEIGGLGWKCLPDGLNVVLTFRRYFDETRGRQLLVRYQFDGQQAPVPTYWTLAPGGEVAFLPLDEVESFTAMAKDSRTVTFRVTDPLYGDNVSFDISLEKLKSALGRVGDCR